MHLLQFWQCSKFIVSGTIISHFLQDLNLLRILYFSFILTSEYSLSSIIPGFAKHTNKNDIKEI